ncbi:MAG: hypothetical protein WBA12_02980, partial [Catalinimonas sp.]
MTRQAEQRLRERAATYDSRYKHERSRALRAALRYGWPVERMLPDGTTLVLRALAAGGLPIYDATDSNLDAARTVAADRVWPDGAANLALTGRGVRVGG